MRRRRANSVNSNLARYWKPNRPKATDFGRGERIRTSDLSVPNRAHYQAVLRPVLLSVPIGETGHSSHHQKPRSRIAKNSGCLSRHVHDGLFRFSLQLTILQSFGHIHSG